MKIYICTDMEGISGIDSMDMMQIDSPQYEYCRKRLMYDVNAAIEGAFDGGATQVVVKDGHGPANNFIIEMLDKRAEVNKNKTADYLDSSFDAMMLVGYHAMAGTYKGFLDHTQNSKSWYNYYVNGKKTGEIGQMAIIAAQYDLPVIMVTGDKAACDEAREFLGPVECAVVKHALERNKAQLVDTDEALERVKISAKKSLNLINIIKPYKPCLPLDIKLELYRTDFCDEIARKKGVERLDARSVRKFSNNYLDILF